MEDKITPEPIKPEENISNTIDKQKAVKEIEAVTVQKQEPGINNHRGLQKGKIIFISVLLFAFAGMGIFYIFWNSKSNNEEPTEIESDMEEMNGEKGDNEDIAKEKSDINMIDYFKIEAPFIGGILKSPIVIKGKAKSSFFPSGVVEIRLEDTDEVVLGKVNARSPFPLRSDSFGMMEFSAKIVFETDEEKTAKLVIVEPIDSEINIGNYEIPVNIKPREEQIIKLLDADDDGLYDFEEEWHLTNVNKKDTDDDGYSDGDEVRLGFNPNGPGMLLLGLNTPESAILKLERAQASCDGDFFIDNLSFSDRIINLDVDVENMIGVVSEEEIKNKILEEIYKVKIYANEVEKIEVLEKNYLNPDKLYIDYLVHYEQTTESSPEPMQNSNVISLINNKWMVDAFAIMEYEIREMNDLDKQRKEARDDKRIADIKQIQSALELYYNDESKYPDVVIPGEILEGKAVYMPQVPKNPEPAGKICDNTSEYVYTVKDSNRAYEIVYCLEDKKSDIPRGVNIADQDRISNRLVSEEALAGVMYTECEAINTDIDEPEERNTKRWDDVGVTISAIKLHQIDNEGKYHEVIENLEHGIYYQLGNGVNCNSECNNPRVELASNCIDISYLKEEGYLYVIPIDPNLKITSEERTGYYLQKLPGNEIVVGSCYEEPGLGGITKEISIKE